MPSRKTPQQFPLAEVFGFPPGNATQEAERYRHNKWCPFNNPTGPNCTKDSIENPLGVCSIMHAGSPTITCPVRFRQDWRIIDDAAAFFFPDRSMNLPAPRMLSEVPLKDAKGKSAGNIDMVLVTLDDTGVVTDYGALEIQAVYISGNVRGLFKRYMEDPANYDGTWSGWQVPNLPHPDYLSSSRKRLAPQLLFKGGILNAWKRKMAVAVQRSFFRTLPHLEAVAQEDAQLAWLVYDLEHKADRDQHDLVLSDVVYTRFTDALFAITTPDIGEEGKFLADLQNRVRVKKTPPDVREVAPPYDLSSV
ncbi:MAG: NotI family restriction endonuclease [Chloroflexia bacterium]